MGFHTISFWLLFACFLLVYQIFPKRVLKNTLLLIASYAFYASWSVYFLPLILFSTFLDFFAGHWVGPSNKTWQRNLALISSLFINFGLLFTFKYFLDFTDPEVLESVLGNSFSNLLFKIGVPIGISFYTFQTLSYSFDVYRGKIKATRSLLDFALYVSFFPQLLAGPIEKARRLLPQLQKKRNVSLQDYKESICLILLGLFKKVYVADSIAVAVDFVFESENMETNLIFFACILMTFRVYADFSAYSDIARGLARCFGIYLVPNFKPFFVCSSPNAFWRTWHISFMEWVRDYLILPFRKFRKTEFLISVRILSALLFVGLWHQASWNWVVFGLIHGMAILCYRWWSLFKRKYHINRFSYLQKCFGFLFMIHIYFLSGLLHRSGSLEKTFSMFQSINLLCGWHGTMNYLIYSLQFLGPLFLYEIFILKKKDEFFILKSHWLFRAFVIALALSFITIFERMSEPGFIYFDF